VVLAAPAAGFFADTRDATGSVAWEFRLRGSAPVVFTFEDGELTMDSPNGHAVDLHMSARAAPMLLVMYRRIGPLRPALRGDIMVWGRRPWKLGRVMKAIQTA
jgi:hypothetical protein